MFPFSFISGIDTQALASYNSLIAAGYTVPQGITGIDNAFKTIKNIYGTSDITTAVSYFADPSLAYQSGAGSGTTLGQAIRTLPNLVDNTRATDAVQTTAASQPLLLVHEGANYWQGVGVAGNFVSTPNAAANQITGDIEIIACAEFQSWTSYTSFRGFVAKWNAGSAALSYGLNLTNTGLLNFIYSTSGSYQAANDKNSSVAVPFTANQKGWVKCTFTASTAIIRFYTSLDGITWTQLGANVAASGTSIHNSSQTLNIGQSNDSSSPYSNLGKIYRVTISNSIGGAPVVDFNPSQYNASVSQTQWTSSTGEIWSINTDTAATGYKGVLVNRTILQGDGVDDRMSTSLASYQYITRYASALQYTMASGARMLAGTGSGHLLYNFVNPNIRAFNGVDLDFNNETINRLQLFTANYNSLTSTGLLNNANTASGDTGTNSSTVLSILSNSSSAQFANAGITTILQARQVDNTAQNTAMYNYIRSINNNAF